MREDIYGPKLWAIINEATEPITAATLTREAGCSKQRTYQWIAQAREQGVVEVGRNTRGAALFQLQAPAAIRRNRRGDNATGNQAKRNGIARVELSEPGILAQSTTTLSIDPRSMLGLAMQVTGVRLDTGGGYVLELAGDDGVNMSVQVQMDAPSAARTKH